MNMFWLIIRESDVWNRLREKAVLTLASFGLSADMSVEEIDQLGG
jgi:hypothetical protein